MHGFRTILHPTDFSDASRYAFQTACALARDYDATLILLHVVPPSVALTLPGPSPNPFEAAETQDCWIEHFSWPRSPDPNIRVERRVSEGDPADEILRVARALKCDLIVMGTHGLTWLGRLLIGSVAEEVFRKADCPVMIVRTPLREPAPAEPATRARPGDVLDARPVAEERVSARTKPLLQAGPVEIARVVVPAGEEIVARKERSETTVQCLQGRVCLTVFGKTRTLEAGNLVYLPAGEPYTLKGVEDASLLVTNLEAHA